LVVRNQLVTKILGEFFSNKEIVQIRWLEIMM